MSMPGEHDFIDQRAVWVGATWSRAIQQRVDAATGISLAGWTVTFVVTNDDGTVVLTLGVGTGITVTDEAEGKLTVLITAAQSTAAGVGLRKYTLKLTSGATTIVRLTGRIAFVDSQ